MNQDFCQDLIHPLDVATGTTSEKNIAPYTAFATLTVATTPLPFMFAHCSLLCHAHCLFCSILFDDTHMM